MHRAAFAALGLDLDYVAVRVPEGRLHRGFPGLRRRFLGLNVTRPHKEAIVPLLDRLTGEARAAGSVNTVTFGDGEAVGDSTDGPGFLAALRRARPAPPSRAVVLGTGGAARAVALALAREGAEVTVSGRNGKAGRRLAAHLAGVGPGRVRFAGREGAPLARLLDGADLLVNATPVGGWPEDGRCPVPEEVRLPPSLVVFDLVYRPRRTRLLERAAAAGCVVVEGVEMLVEQGARSLQAWVGRPAPVEVMREAAYRALASPPRSEGELVSPRSRGGA
jgi:shikimate dehydrogenase